MGALAQSQDCDFFRLEAKLDSNHFVAIVAHAPPLQVADRHGQPQDNCDESQNEIRQFWIVRVQ
jgi:hypothetical protein